MTNEYMKKRLISWCKKTGHELIYLSNRGVYQLKYGDTRHYFSSLSSLYNSVFVKYDFCWDDSEIWLA